MLLGRKINTFYERQKLRCNKECGFDGECLSFVDIEVISKYTEQFWGEKSSEVKLPAERANSIQSLWTSLKGVFNVS
jgi:hypothetical protein